MHVKISLDFRQRMPTVSRATFVKLGVARETVGICRRHQAAET